MIKTRSLLEKAVRSAIQRHLRSWAPYPNVKIVPLSDGHDVHWHAADDVLNQEKVVKVTTTGTPSHRGFSIVSIVGERKWSSSDRTMMDYDSDLQALKVWATPVSIKHLNTLSLEECSRASLHLRESFRKNPDAYALLELVDIQQFEPRTALHTALDALAIAFPVNLMDWDGIGSYYFGACHAKQTRCMGLQICARGR